MLEVQQAGHQAQGKTRAARCGDTGARDLKRRAEEILVFQNATGAHPAYEVRGQCSFDLRPGKLARQHRQVMAQVDHLGAEEISCVGASVLSGIAQISQKSATCSTNPEGFGAQQRAGNPVCMRAAGDLQGRLPTSPGD
jgi:hypothetical protein